MKCLCPNDYVPLQGECISCTNISGIIVDPITKKCNEICGDGKKITNQYACDDGNSINGDGCSSSCEVEEGWRCSGGSPTTPDICKNIAPILITLSAKNNDNGPVVIIQFNKQIRIAGKWEDVFKMEILGETSYNMQLPTTTVGESFNITITTDKTIRDSYFQLTILKSQNIVDDLAATKIYTKKHTLKLPDFTYIPFEQRQYSQQISNAASGISLGMIASFIPLLLSGNFFLLANTIEITEMIYHYQFIDVRYPFNVNQFFLVFNNFELPMVPNIFEFFYDKNIQLYSPDRLQEIKIDSFFMRNAGQSFTILFALIALHIFVKLLSLNCNKWKRLKNYCQELLKNQLKYAFYFDFITTTYLNLAVSSFMQFYDSSYESTTLVANLIFSYGTFLLVIIWPFFIAYYIYVRRDTIHQEEVQEKMSSLMEGLKTDTLFQAMFQILVFLRKLYLAFIVNFMISATHMQMNFLGFFNIFFVLLRVTYKPQKLVFQEFVNIVTEVLLFTTQICIQQLKDDINQTEEERVQSGWSIIAFSSAIMVFHAAFLAYEILKVLITYIKKKREERKLKQQIQPNKNANSSASKANLNHHHLMSIENINEENKPSLETKEHFDINNKNMKLGLIAQADLAEENNIISEQATNRYFNDQPSSSTHRNLIVRSMNRIDNIENQSQNFTQIQLGKGATRNSIQFGSYNFSSKQGSAVIPMNDEQN